MLTQRALTQSGEAASASSHSLMSGEGVEGVLLKALDPAAGLPGPWDSVWRKYRCGMLSLSCLDLNPTVSTSWLCEPWQVA